jgi:chemotaxis signal transduction protein
MTQTTSSSQFDLPLANTSLELLVLEMTIAGQVHAIRADCIQRVLPIAAWISQPEMPDHVVGMLGLEAEWLPVVDARSCLGFESRLPSIEDHLVLVQSGKSFLIWIDRANTVRGWNATDTLLNLEIFDPTVYP